MTRTASGSSSGPESKKAFNPNFIGLHMLSSILEEQLKFFVLDYDRRGGNMVATRGAAALQALVNAGDNSREGPLIIHHGLNAAALPSPPDAPFTPGGPAPITMFKAYDNEGDDGLKA